MKKNGHDFIDILKIDIESREFETLGSFLRGWAMKNRHSGGAHGGDEDDAEAMRRPLPFGQLLIEFHIWDDRGRRFADFLDWFEMLEDAGLRPFRSEVRSPYISLTHW